MIKNFLANYKTSLIGIGIAALTLWQDGANTNTVLLSIGIALLGILAKDWNIK